jgi:predicted Zn-dependent protease
MCTTRSVLGSIPGSGSLRGSGWALLAIVFAVACATSPLGRRQVMLVNDAQMDEMGVQAFEQLKTEGKLSSDAKTNAYVTCVAKAITDQLPAEFAGNWEVRVFQDDTANAFALPGSKIGVHTGILPVARNQDQLAAVLGHEVAHVLARHGAERVSNQVVAQGGVEVLGALLGASGDPSSPLHGVAMQALGVGAGLGTMAYGRQQESEADLYGLDLMARAGFDPRASVPLWQNMAAASGGDRPPEFLSTHPNPETRIADLQRRIPQSLPVMEQARAAGRRPRCG